MNSNGATTQRCFVLAIICSLVLGGTINAQETKPNSPPTTETSPLHALLGIDQETGQFKPGPPPQPGQNPAPAANGANQPLRDLQSIDLNNPDELAKTVTNLLNSVQQNQSGQGGNADDVANLLGLSSEKILEWHRIITFISGGVCLLFPLGRFLFAVLVYLFRSRRPDLTEADHRYARTHFWQNVILSGLTAALILVLTVATAYVEWWTEPRIMIGLGIAAAVLGVSTVTLSLLIKNSTRELNYETMCEMRERQFALKKEIDDLKKRLKAAQHS